MERADCVPKVNLNVVERWQKANPARWDYALQLARTGAASKPGRTGQMKH